MMMLTKQIKRTSTWTELTFNDFECKLVPKLDESFLFNMFTWTLCWIHHVLFFGTAITHIGRIFDVHFAGISTTNVPPGRQFEYVHTENTKFTANIHAAFQCRTSRCRRCSPRLIQCSCISTTTTGKFNQFNI